MSGHSHWSTIQRQKGTADAKRGQVFTKLASLITIAAKVGGSGDPDSNPRLRMVLETARSANMPKENIQRAIDRGLGKLPGQSLEEVVYEGFGPSKVAFILEGISDNKARTLQEVRNAFERGGGNLGGLGSVSYMFDKKGEIRVISKGAAAEDEMLEIIDMGAEDVEDYIEEGVQKYLVYTESSELFTMGNKVTQAGYGTESKDLVFKPNLSVEVAGEQAQKVIGLAEKLEELADIQRVFMNAEFTE
jgi:YebC/PmpR family DNA-binding regulatory protein